MLYKYTDNYSTDIILFIPTSLWGCYFRIKIYFQFYYCIAFILIYQNIMNNRYIVKTKRKEHVNGKIEKYIIPI